MNIGIDMDGVIIDTINFLSKEFTNHFECAITPEDVAHRLTKLPGAVDYLNENEEYLLCSLPPIEGAVGAINKLNNVHDIYLISARFGTGYDMTVNWLKKYGINYDNLIFTDHKPKTSICKEHKIDVFIEDSVKNAIDILEADVPVILYETKYNRGFNHNKAVKCKNWQEIELAIEKMFK